MRSAVRVCPDPPSGGRTRVSGHGSHEGAVAQLGERLPCTQEVSGSIPLSSTTVVVGGRAQSREAKAEAKAKTKAEAKAEAEGSV